MKCRINPDCRKLIAEGKCKADCCGIVPFERQTFMQIKHKAYEKNYIQHKVKVRGQNIIIPQSEDGICIFLNKQDYSCTIYNSPRKPELCRQFGMIENEPLMACKHINPELSQEIDNQANEVIEQLKNLKGDKYARQI